MSCYLYTVCTYIRTNVTQYFIALVMHVYIPLKLYNYRPIGLDVYMWHVFIWKVNTKQTWSQCLLPFCSYSLCKIKIAVTKSIPEWSPHEMGDIQWKCTYTFLWVVIKHYRSTEYIPFDRTMYNLQWLPVWCLLLSHWFSLNCIKLTYLLSHCLALSEIMIIFPGKSKWAYWWKRWNQKREEVLMSFHNSPMWFLTGRSVTLMFSPVSLHQTTISVAVSCQGTTHADKILDVSLRWHKIGLGFVFQALLHCVWIHLTKCLVSYPQCCQETFKYVQQGFNTVDCVCVQYICT